MQKRIVIDTNIWVKAMIDDDYMLECDDALKCFFQNKDLLLALDCGGEIEREYRDNICGSRQFEIRMKQLNRENRKCWCSSNLNQKQEKDLYDLKFHEKEDHIFVGTAMNADRIIMTEDSDYGVHGEELYQGVYTYMKDKMDLTVLSGIQFYEQFR